jgi:hypothetical protein
MPGLHAAQGDDANSIFATDPDSAPAEIPPFQARKPGDSEPATERRRFPLTTDSTATTVSTVQ